MNTCMQCGKELEQNDIGAFRKFVNRGASSYLCRDCLSEKLGVSRERLEEKIADFKRQGCTLFV